MSDSARRSTRLGCGLAAAFALLAASATATGQQPTSAQAGAIRESCRSDYSTVCAGVPTGGSAALSCLQKNAAKTSGACQQALRAVGGGAPQAAAAPVAASAPAPQAADTWPHTVTTPNGVATIYQPQVVSWPDHRTLNARVAMGITRTGAKAPVYGTVDVAFATRVELADREVVLTEPALTAARFPTFDAAQSAQVEERVRAALAGMQSKRVPLAAVIASLREQAGKPPAVAIDNTPPRIFASSRPASLVVFDGDPVLAPIAGTSLSFAVNTNWDVFSDAGTKTWYLLSNGGWLAAPAATGPWSPAGALPPAFSALPADANFADVKKQVPGRALSAKEAPTVFVSTAPAAIIVIDGPPKYVAIPGTSLQYVANTDAALFRNAADSRLYYLVSGRWFAAVALDGPWVFATDRLPADFARIPASGSRGFVRVSVPGTPEAQEALLEAQVPQQATLARETAKLTVVYAGEPRFVAIAGTPMSYAANTSFNVVQTGEGYFSCYQGAWFAAPAPVGPWVLATSLPTVIYTIPPTHPMYPCTYVRIYASTPTTVTYGYTSGYTMSYVSAGVVVYGTGYYYPPYIYPGPIPIYYPYPYSYAGATYYNPATGAWAHGGAIYGPYGGVAKGGTAYNPTTGAWAQGGAIYGPNGGAGAFSAYNPTNGSYAHGSAAWGPDGASGNASWYNANTGRSGSTQQNSNAYGRWGSSTISGPNQTVHTQSQSNARGSAGSFTSTSGAEGAGVKGAGGNSAGAVKTSSGNVYAGADGNVYKKTDDGWEKYDNGSWNSVQKPANTPTQRSSTSQQNLSGQTQRTVPTQSGTAPARESAPQRSTSSGGNLSGATDGSSKRGEGAGAPSGVMGQLEGDHQARTWGAQRQQQTSSMRQGGFAERGGSGRSFRR